MVCPRPVPRYHCASMISLSDPILTAVSGTTTRLWKKQLWCDATLQTIFYRYAVHPSCLLYKVPYTYMWLCRLARLRFAKLRHEGTV